MYVRCTWPSHMQAAVGHARKQRLDAHSNLEANWTKEEQVMPHQDSTNAGSMHRHIPFLAFGLSLSLFFTISYVLCVMGYLLFPTLPVAHSSLSMFLPGFTLLSWRSFLLGLAESFVWGWYVTLVFVPLYNFWASRAR